jgi:hypothetical protein
VIAKKMDQMRRSVSAIPGARRGGVGFMKLWA